jgi:hypothetical protein
LGPRWRPLTSLVDGLLADKFNEVLASGKLSKPLAPQEAEALKATSFGDVAAKATTIGARVSKASPWDVEGGRVRGDRRAGLSRAVATRSAAPGVLEAKRLGQRA